MLEHTVTIKGKVVSVQFYDNEDQKQAKHWIKVEVPPEELKASAKKNPGLLQELDEFAFGKSKGSPSAGDDLDRHLRRAALSHLKKVIETEIDALKP